MKVVKQMINITPTKQKFSTKGQTNVLPGALFSYTELRKRRGKFNVTCKYVFFLTKVFKKTKIW